MAERGGFEPPVEALIPYNRLAICPVQPLQHLSARGIFSEDRLEEGPIRKTSTNAAGPRSGAPSGVPHRGTLAVVGLALVVRAVVALQLLDHPLLQPVGRLDSGVYVDLARSVAAGDVALRSATGVEPFFLAPLYVYFLALSFALSSGSLVAAKVLQVLVGGGAVGLLYAAARPWLGRPAALAAAALLALAGPVAFHEAVLLQAALDPFLIALALLAVSRALRAGRWREWVLAGAAIGLFALNRPNALAWGAAPRGPKRETKSSGSGSVLTPSTTGWCRRFAAAASRKPKQPVQRVVGQFEFHPS